MHNEEIYNLISKKIPNENILIDEPMKKHTSFKIGGNADFFVRVNNLEEIKYIIEICNKKNIPLTILGNGSNVLIKDNGIRGIVLKVDIEDIKYEDIIINNNLKENDLNELICKRYSGIKDKMDYNIFDNNLIKDNKETNKYCVVTLGAGVKLGMLAQLVAKKSLTGFEFASGIPGCIGGAVRMNAGAYGKEFSDIVLETKCIDLNGNIKILSNEEQKFNYRTSIFKDKKYIILETKILLKYVENNTQIFDKMNEYKESRLEKQPVEFPSAGSTFKRGSNFITAKLIDECGLKGYRVGDAQVSQKHAGFIVNLGNATAKDVLELTRIVKNIVYEKFKCYIELEIEVIGE